MDINSNLDIWSIQCKSEEILYALDGIQNKGTIILFTNLESSFEMAGVEVNKRFDNVLWVKQEIKETDRIEKNGRLIKFMEGSKFSEDTQISEKLSFNKGDQLGLNEIKKILEEKGVKYIQLDSKQRKIEDDSLFDKNIPEVWTVRFLEVLESGITANNKEATIYPDIESSLTLKYFETENTGYLIDRIDFKGLVVFNDKVFLLVNHTKKELSNYKKDMQQIIRGGWGNITGYKPITLTNVKQLLLKRGITIEEKEGLPTFLQNDETKSRGVL